MAQLTPEQKSIAKTLLARGVQEHATARPLKALFEAGLTESGLRNLNYGDRDSLGVLQQRSSTGWQHATNPSLAAKDFLAQAQRINDAGFHGSAGQLAQAVQRSAFPARYDQQGGQAASILASLGGGPAGSTGATRTTTTTPGIDNTGVRRSLIAAFLTDQHNPNALMALASGLQGAKDTAATTKTSMSVDASDPNQLVPALVSRANTINAKKLPYKWGGGHQSKVNPSTATPLDCSGAVSAVLGINPRVSGQFKSWGKPGEGGNATVYANDHHVLMKVRGNDGAWHFFGTSQSNPGGGAGWIPQADISPEYLKGFTARHL